MITILNTIGDGTKPNTHEILDLMTKSRLLRAIQSTLLQPDTHVLGVACDVAELEINALEANELTTLSEWLDEKGIELDRSGKHKFANILTKLYRETYGRQPRVVARPDNKGKYIKKASAFADEELEVLEKAWKLYEIMPTRGAYVKK